MEADISTQVVVLHQVQIFPMNLVIRADIIVKSVIILLIVAQFIHGQ